jgi:hypothetical protein
MDTMRGGHVVALMLFLSVCANGYIPPPESRRVAGWSAPRTIGEAALAYTGEPHGAALADATLWASRLHAVAAALVGGGDEARAWGRTPVLTRELAPLILGAGLSAGAGAGPFFGAAQLERAVDERGLDAGLGHFDTAPGGDEAGGWRLYAVARSEGEPTLRWPAVRAALDAGTVVFNAVGPHESALASLCLGGLAAFGLPVNCNVYATAAGRQTSAPAHTDGQDVLILQTAGRKAWAIYAPPAPAARALANPFARGKGDDRLSARELGEPLLRVTLEAGDALYVPAGFPHATSTALAETGGDAPAAETAAAGADADADADAAAAAAAAAAAGLSIHVTLNLGDMAAGLSYERARRALLGRAGAADWLRAPPTSLSAFEFWSLHEPLPFGCFEPKAAQPAAEAAAEGAQAQSATVDAIVRGLRARLALPRGGAPSFGEGTLALDACAHRMAEHRVHLLCAHWRMLLDGALELTPCAPGQSALRVNPYILELEEVLRRLDGWARPVRPSTTAVATAQAPPRQSQPAAPSEPPAPPGATDPAPRAARRPSAADSAGRPRGFGQSGRR